MQWLWCPDVRDFVQFCRLLLGKAVVIMGQWKAYLQSVLADLSAQPSMFRDRNAVWRRRQALNLSYHAYRLAIYIHTSGQRAVLMNFCDWCIGISWTILKFPHSMTVVF